MDNFINDFQRLKIKEDEGDNKSSGVPDDVPDLEETPAAEEVAEPAAFKSDMSPFSQTEGQYEAKIRKPKKGKSNYLDSEFEKLRAFQERMPKPEQIIFEDEEVKPVKSLKVPKSSKAVKFKEPTEEKDDEVDEEEEEVKPVKRKEKKALELKSKFKYAYKSKSGGFTIPQKNRAQTSEIMENLRSELWFTNYAQNLSDKERENAIKALTYKKLQTELAKFK
jgi:hypothetical protein